MKRISKSIPLRRDRLWRSVVRVSGACLILFGTVRAHAGAVAAPPEPNVLRNQMVAMRDGTKLAADIYLPQPLDHKLPGGWPVILMRTPYNKIVRAAPFASFFVAHGYAVAGNHDEKKIGGVFTNPSDRRWGKHD